MPENPSRTARTHERMARVTLPIMHRTARELRTLLDAPRTRYPQMQDVLSNDPAATIALFRHLGQVRPAALDSLTDATHALSLLGAGAFRELLDSLPQLAHDPDQPRGSAGPTRAYSQAAHAAFYAVALAREAALPGAAGLQGAALLQHPAILALWIAEPESAQRASNAMRDGVPTSIAFGAELGEPLARADLRLGQAWSFPRLARSCMDGAAATDPRTGTIRLADDLAQSSAAGWQHEDHDSVTQRLAAFLKVEPDRATGWLHRTATDAARALADYDYPLPGFELIFVDCEACDEGDLPALPASQTETPGTVTPSISDLHGTVSGIMREARRDTGAERMVFMMLDGQRTRLRTRLALGGDSDDGLRRLNLELRRMNLFTALMSKPQSVWLSPDNAARYRAYLPDSLRRLLAPEGAYLMSIFVRQRPLGLLYGDGRQLSETGYRSFRAHCNRLVAALDNDRPGAVD